MWLWRRHSPRWKWGRCWLGTFRGVWVLWASRGMCREVFREEWTLGVPGDVPGDGVPGGVGSVGVPGGLDAGGVPGGVLGGVGVPGGVSAGGIPGGVGAVGGDAIDVSGAGDELAVSVDVRADVVEIPVGVGDEGVLTVSPLNEVGR